MLPVVEIDERQRDYWDEAISQFDTAHPLNAFGWGKVRAVDGWSPTYFMVHRNEAVAGAVMILTKAAPLNGMSLMYAPKGPVCSPFDREAIEALLCKIRMEAKKKRAVFLRTDPNIQEDVISSGGDPFVNAGFIHLEHRWTFWNSPRDVYRIDLTKHSTAEEIFNSFDRDTRRCVRKARNEGVTIRPAESLRELEIFYAIFSEFSVRKGFMARSYAYQKSLWDEFISRGKGRLFLAIYQGQIIGGLICLIFAGKCLAMHMGTPYKYQKLQTYYAYLWESIKWAKENGCLWYSFRGIGTTPGQEGFKKKFGPKAVSLVGYYDLPFYYPLYRLFSFGEFEVLPRAWPILMKLRQSYNGLAAGGR